MLKRLMISIGITALLASCVQDEPSPPSFKVALLSPGPVSDAGWNASAYEGLLRIKDELGAEISQIETKTPSEFEEAFRDYGRRGYALAFGHGFEFQDAAVTVAVDFPKTVFIVTAGNRFGSNYAPMVFQLEEATYLAGMLAAELSKTGKVGAVGGMPIPPVERTFRAFANGARAVNSEIRYAQSFIGNWEDAGAARQATLALIDQGCDLIIHNADAAAAGVFQAAQERGVLVFGTNRNQNDLSPQHIVASCVSDIPQAYVEMARLVKEQRFESKIYELGMRANVVSFITNPALESQIPAEVLARLATARTHIIDGEIQVLGEQ